VHWLSSSRERANFISKQRRKQDGYQQKTNSPLRCGNIKATICKNTSEKGPFVATTFSRPYKDQFSDWSLAGCNGV